ncbi:MAG: GcvT family protein, partial [Rhodospirillaceae bacterium]|nr:GcvT family protein [Rhodospirillaceae bacterium]
MEQARVVVIGGGITGVCCLYQLALAGETDVMLVEREELTAGSSWHAAGHVTPFSGNWGNMRAQHYAKGFYEELARTVDYPFSFHIDGCLYPARSPERMDHLHYVSGIARGQGLEMPIIDVAEMERLHPFLKGDGLIGGLLDPYEGAIDPAQVVHAVATGARALGARIKRHNPVETIEQQADSSWILRCREGDIRAEIVVNAAGFRGGEVAAMMGQDIPLVTLAHQYVVTEDLPAVAERDQRFPIFRDLGGEYYFRQERDGLLLGSYGHAAHLVWHDGVPPEFGQELFADDLSQLEAIYDSAAALFPMLDEAGIQRFVNGPIPYAPDAQPLVGPAPGLSNAYHACAVQIGFCQGPAAGKAIAEMILEGETEWDSWTWDPRRFGDWATQEFTGARICELYENQYAAPFPHRVWQAGRPVARSPLHDVLKAKGAVHAQIGGWERPIWFQTQTARDDGQLSFRHESWTEAVTAECEAVRDRVGVMDHCGFTRYLVEGPGAADWLDWLFCGRLPRQGRVDLRYVLSKMGKVLTEATVTCLADNSFVLLGPTLAERRDFDIFQRLLPADGSVVLTNESGTRATLMVMGPQSRELLARLTKADLSAEAAPWMSAREITVAGAEVLALRVSFVGELGWELHMAMADAPGVYDALWREGADLGLADFGSYGLNAMRIEKGYHGWQAEFGIEYTPFDAGLDRFVAFDKGPFRGRDAVLAQRDKPADWV